VDTAFKSFYALVLTVLASIAYKLLDLGPQVATWLQPQLLALSPEVANNPHLGSYIHLAIIAALGWMFFHSRNIATAILAALPSLRRLLAWSDYIEGDWPLVVIDRTTGQLKYQGFLTVAYKGGYLTVSGEDWNPDGSHAVSFKSMQTYYSEGTLHYWYMQGEGGRQRGYTFIEFFPRKSVATHLTGVFHDKEHPDVRFYGQKLRYGWFQRRTKTMGSRKEAAIAFAAQIMPRVPTMLATTVDADWE